MQPQHEITTDRSQYKPVQGITVDYLKARKARKIPPQGSLTQGALCPECGGIHSASMAEEAGAYRITGTDQVIHTWRAKHVKNAPLRATMQKAINDQCDEWAKQARRRRGKTKTT